jgi:drug/metabolite transporter (DMT)-like permease
MVPPLLGFLDLAWLWIPLTIWAAFAQTLRNAAQRHLVTALGTLGATLVRFLYGLPFAAAYAAAVLYLTHEPVPAFNWSFLIWVVVGGVVQIGATALLLRVMEERNFTLGVAYSKSEVVQAAIFAAIFLGDLITPLTALAVILATVGVMLLSAPAADKSLGSVFGRWDTRVALLGVGSGAGFALSAVGYRGAALSLHPTSAALAAAYTLVWAQLWQSFILGGWLLVRKPDVVLAVLRAWRASLLAGFMGAAASVGWFTAMALEPVAHVRTLGLMELLFSYAISQRLFKEKLRPIEIAGIALLVMGLVSIALFGRAG